MNTPADRPSFELEYEEKLKRLQETEEYNETQYIAEHATGEKQSKAIKEAQEKYLQAQRIADLEKSWEPRKR